MFSLRPDFQCDFFLMIDVNEWINNECAEYMLPHNYAIHITGESASIISQAKNMADFGIC